MQMSAVVVQEGSPKSDVFSVSAVSARVQTKERKKRAKSVTPPQSDGEDTAPGAQVLVQVSGSDAFVGQNPEDAYDEIIVQASRQLEQQSDVVYMDLGNGMRTAIFKTENADFLLNSTIPRSTQRAMKLSDIDPPISNVVAKARTSAASTVATSAAPAPISDGPNVPNFSTPFVPMILPTNPLAGTFGDLPETNTDSPFNGEATIVPSKSRRVNNANNDGSNAQDESADSATKDEPTVDDGSGSESTTYTIVDVESAFVDFFEKLNVDLDAPLTLRVILSALGSSKVVTQVVQIPTAASDHVAESSISPQANLDANVAISEEQAVKQLEDKVHVDVEVADTKQTPTVADEAEVVENEQEAQFCTVENPAQCADEEPVTETQVNTDAQDPNDE